MWRLAYGVNPSLMYGHAASPSLIVPFEAGKTIMAQLDVVSQTSKDCHGIGIVRRKWILHAWKGFTDIGVGTKAV